MQADLITVPACVNCNGGASEDDEDLRFYLSVQVGKPTDGATQLWDRGAHKTLIRKTKLRVPFLDNMREVTTTDQTGKPVKRLGFEAPLDLYQRVFERIVRGLYFHHTERILPPDTPVLVDPIEDPNLLGLKSTFLKKGQIGERAFVYHYAVETDDALNSFWFFEFHDRHYVLVNTGRLCADDACR